MDNSGSEFPTPSTTDRHGDTTYGEAGMTLRDYFAAKAMVAIMSSSNLKETGSAQELAINIGGTAYAFADLMLIARRA